jgi:hypothetical protein
MTRVAADRPFYSGKHRHHGMNLQVISSPSGDILWVSGALPRSVHDKKAEWIWGVLRELEAAGLLTLADKGCQGSTWASRRKKRTALTRSSAPLARGRTPCSRTGGSSASSAAAPGAPDNSPNPRRITRLKKAQSVGTAISRSREFSRAG